MKSVVPLIIIFSLLASSSHAQFTRYLVRFKNKGNNPYSLSNPSAYLSQRAIERRTQYNIPLDSTDLPVTPNYLLQVAAIPNVTILNASKWLNQVSVQTTDATAITAINALPFVQNVSGIAARTMNSGNEKTIEDENIPINNSVTARVQDITADYYDYGTTSYKEIHLHNGDFLHNIGLRGEGMQIAMIDAGFLNYNTYKAFDSINANGQVLATWDFVARETSVAEDHSHGMACLSTIAANIPGQFIGTAPKTSFYLYRTEDAATEYPIEEHNWVCGAERADSSGANVISSSLGYTIFSNTSFDHAYADMDGNTTMAANAADLAAKKGILVFVAAGNEGANPWHYVMTPADADSVVTVGAVNVNGLKGNFSSFGPTADGRIKPDVMSVGVGTIIETAGNTIGTSQGTSYACPKMAGLGTCLWQGFPEFNNMKIVEALRQSGSTTNNPTDSIGYGIPDVKLAFTKLLTDFASSNASITNCTATINWTSKDISAMKYEIERKLTTDNDYIKIGEITPQGGSSLINHSYQFNNTLSDVKSGNISYRIRQIVDTASATFTAVYIDTTNISLTTDCDILQPQPLNEGKITVSPNPFNDELIFTVETASAIPSLIINIYDMQGRLMQQTKESKAAGKIKFIINATKLTRGKYNIEVLNATKRIGVVPALKL